jgi:hypothetical protein
MAVWSARLPLHVGLLLLLMQLVRVGCVCAAEAHSFTKRMMKLIPGGTDSVYTAQNYHSRTQHDDLTHRQ